MTDFDLPARVAGIMIGFKHPWFIAGGWAIDLHLGRITRFHDDIEIAILRLDQLGLQVHLSGWKLEMVVPGSDTPREPWAPGRYLELPIHEIHAVRPDHDPPHLEILLNESIQEQWVFRRNPLVTSPLAAAGRKSKDGIPYLAPEIILLYKAANPAAKDMADFNLTYESLTTLQRQWLYQAIRTCYPGHPWLSLLPAD